MHVEENYPNFHKSQIKGKQWLKQWLVKMGSKQSNNEIKVVKNARKLKFKKKKKDEIELKRKDPKNLKYGGKNGQIYCNGEILFSTPICLALLG
jgi:hypothetical protein